MSVSESHDFTHDAGCAAASQNRADATRVDAQPSGDEQSDFELSDSVVRQQPRALNAPARSADATVALTKRVGGRHVPQSAPEEQRHDTLRDARPVEFVRPQVGLSDYELLSEVARGGMGVVYRARQRSLNRVVAVKMILAGHLASDEDVQRFRSEAEAAANLQHPNIIAIYEVGESDGQHFFSMQFVEGRSLAELIREKPLSAEEAATVVVTMAEAVDFAHGQGILHRDLKPSNILIDAGGTPHLTDFGVAKRLCSDSQLTSTGTIIGTPSYMPPEQASGTREIGAGADVYSLGAILYELLTGRPPFTAQRPTDVLLQVLNVEPVSPRVLNPSVAQDLSTICLKCLEKAPERRYASALALAADLRRWLAADPISARPIGRWERGWRWCKRNPGIAALTVVLLVVAVGAFVGVTTEWLVAQSALRGMQEARRQRAAAEVESLLQAAPESLPLVLQNLRPQYDDIVDELRRTTREHELSERDRLRLSLALLPGDPSQIDYLRQRMLSVALPELLAIRDALVPCPDDIRAELWDVLTRGSGPPSERFAAALLLARDDGLRNLSGDWDRQGTFLATQLLDSVSADPSTYEALVEAFRRVRLSLIPALSKTFADQTQAQSVRALATNILVNYIADQPSELAKLLASAEPWQFLMIRPRLAKATPDAIGALEAQLDETLPAEALNTERYALARRRAVAAVALVQLGASERAWPLMAHSNDPTLRSHMIELFGQLRTEPLLLIARLNEEPDPSSRRALLLALGSYDKNVLTEPDRWALISRCRDLRAQDPDPGMHACAEWLLRQWGEVEGDLPVASSGPTIEGARWHEGPEGHTFAVIDGGVRTTMGSPSSEDRRSIVELPHAITIGRRFALATKEVSVEQFRRFVTATGVKMPPFTRKHSPDDGGPMIMVTWYRAAQYCRWLSEQAGLAEDQMCYPPIDAIRDGMQPIAGYLNRTGYRLPTEAEWEFACRAGSTVSRSFGQAEELVPHYAWYAANASERAWPRGSLKPNDFGLFDMHGNVWEWCAERWSSYFENPRPVDSEDTTVVNAASNRVLRGGSFDSPPKAVRSAYRERFEKPQFGSDEIGFRVARTVPD
jgi:formylglycine-generating enzyme required for sulfatase activity/predicted Ser/Thr protein kinase